MVKRNGEKVKRSLVGQPAHVAQFGVELDTPNVEAELIKSGYDTNSRTLFNWECVFAQPTRDPRDPVLIFVGSATRGSELALSFAWNAFLAGQGLDNKALTRVTSVMTKKCSMATHGFDSMQSQTASQNRVDHARPNRSQKFKQRYRIHVKMGSDAIEFERFILAEII